MIKQWFGDHILRRMLKNTSFLLVGRVITGLTGLIYLSIVTHYLGAEAFGMLILVQTYVMIITTLTTFQSWQAVIRYGAISLEKQNIASFQRLIKFTTLLDIIGVIVGIALALVIAPILGPHLHWQENLITQVQWCSLSILFTVVATPKGILQLYNRFDLLAFHVTMLPIVQLLGTTIAILYKAPLWGYLLAWFVARVFDGILLIGLGWYEAWKQGLLKGMNWSMSGLTKDHPHLWRFCLTSNFDSSLPMVMRQASPLMIGLVSTPTVVGLFRIGYELSTPLKDIAQLFSQSLYPELAHLSTQKNLYQFKTLMLKTSKVSLGLGLTLFLICLLFGEKILYYGFGPEFTAAYASLLLLVGAEVFTMGSCALEPALYALGYPNLSLQVNAIAVLLFYCPLLVVLTQQFGAIGAGMATLISTTLIFLLNGIMTWLQLQKMLGSLKALQ